MYDAFISYSRANLPLVQTLTQALKDRSLRAFVDVASLRAGKDWPPQLGRAIRTSRMMILCWSAEAAASDWVKAEIQQCLLIGKPLVPWLLDQTPLLPLIARTHAVSGADPSRVVDMVAGGRRRHARRRLLAMAAVTSAVASAAWFAPRFVARESLTFRGRVVDDQGNPVPDAQVEASGMKVGTKPNGEFELALPGPAGGALRVTVQKPGFAQKTIDTQSDVPDLGVVMEKVK